MNKNITRILSVALAILMIAAACATLASCKKDPEGTDAAKTYTYKSGTTALGTNWNPHSWDTNADSAMLGYVTSPFVDMSIQDSKNGVYQWVYEMATAITDVTADNQSDLTKYGVTLPEVGKDEEGNTIYATPEEVTEGYVYEIKLNPDATWENGVKITADDYIYSMQMLLHPKFRNYRANLYYSGESAVAGGAAYYNSESPIYDVVVPAYGQEDTPDYSFDVTAKPVYIHLDATNMTFAGYSFSEIKNDYGYIRDVKDEDGNVVVPGATYFTELSKEANAFGYIKVTEANKEKVLTIMDQFCSAFGISIYDEDGAVIEDYFKEFLFYFTETYGDKVEYDAVGCYKVDEYTIRYVCQQQLPYDYFLTSCTSTWLVYKPLYSGENDEKIDKSGELWTTDYCTSLETTISYGTYKMESLQDGKQVIYVQNENWYGFEKNEDGTPKKDEEGNLISYTNFLVDGKNVRQYTTTKIIIDVMTEDAMKNAFLKGELSEWSPSADELSQYAMSDKLVQVDETYTMSFFFNTGLETLQGLDASQKNVNSVVLSNTNFRKAMSLAIDRAEFVTATAGYKPAFSLMNSLYYYDIYDEDKDDGLAGGETNYRNTEQAMQAIVNLYGVEYGEGKEYTTLKQAHDAITGYNLTEAKALMVEAFNELKEAGLYNGGDIKIQIGWAKGALTSDDQKQVALLNKFINAALEGSGFGEIEFEAIGNINDRYKAVPEGEYAIGYGAWGGAAFYPFRNMQVYCDTVQYKNKINETGCWNPATTELTINIDGEDVTMTWQDWSRACSTGAYANADFDTKLKITATMEEEFLKFYYRIPLCGTTIASLLTYQMEYYTMNYNIMYGFGGLRLMSYNYDDAAWAEVVKAEGTLNYAG